MISVTAQVIEFDPSLDDAIYIEVDMFNLYNLHYSACLLISCLFDKLIKAVMDCGSEISFTISSINDSLYKINLLQDCKFALGVHI